MSPRAPKPLLLLFAALAVAALLAASALLRFDRPGDSGAREERHDANAAVPHAQHEGAAAEARADRDIAARSEAAASAGSAAIADGPLAHESVDIVPPTPPEAFQPSPARTERGGNLVFRALKPMPEKGYRRAPGSLQRLGVPERASAAPARADVLPPLRVAPEPAQPAPAPDPDTGLVFSPPGAAAGGR